MRKINPASHLLSEMLSVTAMLTVRKFFLTSGYAGYVFVAVNWIILAIAAFLIAGLLESTVKLITG